MQSSNNRSDNARRHAILCFDGSLSEAGGRARELMLQFECRSLLLLLLLLL